MEEVTLQQVLSAREERARRQEAMLNRSGTVISFSMNIPGPVKDTPLIRRAYCTGRRQLEDALKKENIPVLECHETLAPTGCESIYAVAGEPLAVKRLCTGVEDAASLGRLFDMDVLTQCGKLDRAHVGGAERGCIVCGAPGRGCASRRSHTVAELQSAARRLMTDYFAAADSRRVGELVTRALLDEVYATPKPGLVDRRNNGSHSDMTVKTFEQSAAALSPYWQQCVAIGIATQNDPPHAAFVQLRQAGLAAEQAMLSATGGVNTHKGAVFTLGAICGAIGRLWQPESPCRDEFALLRQCAALTAPAMAADFAAVTADNAHTAGERLYLRYGVQGIRGEVAEGLPALRETALPMLRRCLSRGLSRNDSGVYALLALIARGTDTNMMARGGLPAAQEASAQAKALLHSETLPALSEIETLDDAFIAKRLSPGGCADLLAAAYFLESWCQPNP